MKKIIGVVLVALVSLMLFGCGSKSYEIALVTDVGNIDDKSFNEGSWNGVKEYAEENNISYAYYRPSEDSTVARVETIKSAIEKGAKIIVCPGYLFEVAIYEVQGEYPDVAFLLLDGQPNDGKSPAKYETKSNVHCILYQEEQAGYLAGYAAVKEGFRSLGFLGGIAVPAVVRFGYGYIQGADAAAQELGLADGSVVIKYSYAGSFAPSDEIKTKMSGWYTTGTQIVFSCGGGIYLSVVQAAVDSGNKKVIGVDVDQSNISELIITSAEKKLTNSVKLALASFYANGGKWDAKHAGKTLTLGAAEECVGLPTASASWRFANFTVAQYNDVFAKLKAGTISVSNSSNPDEIPTTSAKVTVTVE